MADREVRTMRGGKTAAEAAGREAFGEGKPNDPPSGYRAAKGLAAAWSSGWESAEREAASERARTRTVAEGVIRVQEPVVQTQTVDGTVRWPEGKPLPKHFDRNIYFPCAPTPDDAQTKTACLTQELPGRKQAVVVRWALHGAVGLHCRSCSRDFKYPDHPERRAN